MLQNQPLNLREIGIKMFQVSGNITNCSDLKIGAKLKQFVKGNPDKFSSITFTIDDEIVEGWIFKTISIYFTISGDTDQVNLLRESILQSIEKYNS